MRVSAGIGRILLTLIAAVLIFYMPQKSMADAYTWSGLGGDGNWNNFLNWAHVGTGAGYPGGAGQTTDVVTMNETLAGYTVKLGSNIKVASITSLGVLTILNPSPIYINTNGNNITISNALSISQLQVASILSLPSVITPSLLTFTGNGSVTLGGNINVFTGGKLAFGTSGGTNPTVNISGATITMADFIDSSLLSIVSGLLTLLGLNNTTGPIMVNYGTLNLYASSTLNFTGYYSQLLNSGTLNVGPSSTLNFTGSNSGLTNSSVLNLGPTAVLNLNSSTGYVNNTGTFTLQSNSASTATIGKITAGAALTGTFNVQRYFKTGTALTTRNYRSLSSAVYTTTGVYNLAYLNAKSGSLAGVFVAGPGGAANGFTVANATPTVDIYQENVAFSNAGFNAGNFKGLSNITGTTLSYYKDASGTVGTTVLPIGNGFLLYYCGNNISDISSTSALNKQFRVGGNYIAPDTAVTTQIGSLNQGSIPVKLWYSNTTTTLSKTNTGYALVGNPYASSIDWDTYSATSSSAGIYAPNVSSTIYVFNYSSKNYGVYQAGALGGTGTNNATHIIASGQGFFIQAVNASSAASSLTFNESAKTNTQPNAIGLPSYLLLSASQQKASPLLRIKLAKDSVNTDDIMIFFDPTSKNGYEPYWDIDRVDGMGNVSTLGSYPSDSTKLLAINHMHSIDSTTRVKLYVNVSNSTDIDSLTGSGFESLDPRYDVWLIDHYKKDSLFFNRYKRYLFNINNSDTASYGANRFEIVFHRNNGLVYRLLSFTASMVKAGVQLNWTTSGEGDSSRFVVQRADGSKLFLNLGDVQSNGGGSYSYIDKSPLAGLNYYRLQQTDDFGATTFSNIISIINGNATNSVSQATTLSLYPNPVVNQFSVKINTDVPSQVLLRVTNSVGQIMVNQQVPGDNIQQGASNLMPGSYMVQVINKDTQKVIGVTKFVKR